MEGKIDREVVMRCDSAQTACYGRHVCLSSIKGRMTGGLAMLVPGYEDWQAVLL